MEEILLDTETTGFGDCRLVELAYKKSDSAIIYGFRVRPPIPITDGAAQVHGITNEMCKDWPLFADLPEYADVKAMIEAGVVFAHNANFDVGVLEREGIKAKTYIDTAKVARKIYAHAPNYKLQGLRDYLKLDVEGTAHSAAGDVAVLDALLKQMRADMELLGIPPEDHMRSMMVASLH